MARAIKTGFGGKLRYMKLISACLCGLNCRYDGRNNEHPVFAEMLDSNQGITICPEALGGLPIPRLPAEIKGGTGEDVLQGKARVIDRQGNDVTEAFLSGAKKTLDIAREHQVELVILKSRSPSCGIGEIYNGSFSGQLQPGNGVTGALLKAHGLSVVSDEDYLKERGQR